MAAGAPPKVRGALGVGRVRGIPIRLHWTFLLVLPLFAYFMAHAYFPGDPGTGPREGGYLWGAVLAVALFVSVLLHELGHSLVGLRLGLKVKSITLLPIGGVSQFERSFNEPRTEFLVTAAGPAVNFLISAPLLAAWGLGLIPGNLGIAGEALFWVGFLNLVLGGFNLLVPAFPMDGGRILRSALAHRMGLRRGTEMAAGIGRGVAFLMGLWGFFTFSTGGWVLLLIAFFVFTGATQEERQVRLVDTLGRVRVRDVMTKEVHTLDATESVEDAFKRMLETRHLVFPVVEAGAPVAFLHLSDLANVPAGQQGFTRVGDVARKDLAYAEPDMTASDALEAVEVHKGEPLLVMEGHDLVGIVTRTDLQRAAQILDVAHGTIDLGERGGRRGEKGAPG